MLEVFGSSAAGIPVRSIHDVFVEVETGRADYGVVPVENSTEGAVTYTLDELMDTELKITRRSIFACRTAWCRSRRT